MRLKIYFLLAFFAFLSTKSLAQLAASAGNDKTICPGGNTPIGGSPTASGGLAPYTYSWSPATGLSATNIANPIASPTSNTTYTVTVTDDTGAVQTSAATVYMHVLTYTSAGRDTSICENSNALIGSSANIAGITYSWSPGTLVSDSTSPTPIASPGTSTVTYTLTATVAGCPPKTDNVTITVIPTPNIYAGPDTTIQEGEIAILHAGGGYYYAWGNGPEITYIYSSECNVEPIVTTTYYLYGTDATNTCPGYDEVTVHVEASNDVVIYNTFTPNGDGINDYWYIGNIYKYPNNVLEVYNRYGKLVYKTTAYLNNWDGKAYGEDLPSGTYFYDLDLGDSKGTFHGTITIIK